MRDEDDQVDLAVRLVLPDVPPMTAKSFAAGRARMLAGAATPRQRRPVGRWVAAAAAITVGTVGVLSFGGSGITPPANAEAVAVLTGAADVTVHTVDTPVGPGQYRYVKEKRSRWMGVVLRGAGSANCWFRYEWTQETWIPNDPDQDWLRRTTHTDPLETKSCTKDEAVHAPYLFPEVTPWESRAKHGRFADPDHVEPKSTATPDTPPAMRPLGDSTSSAPPENLVNIFHPTPEFLAGVPRDPQQLFTLLRNSTCLDEDCAFLGAQDMLSTGQIPGELRAAVYRALTRISNMTVAAPEANLDGRVGTTIRVTDAGRVRDLIVDPKTGDYIGERTVQDSPAGPLTEASTVTTGVADAIGVPPTR